MLGFTNIIFSDNMNRSDKLYQDFFKKYLKAHGSVKSKKTCQNDANEIWRNEVKVGKKIDEEKYVEAMAKLDETVSKKSGGNIKNFLKKNNNNVVSNNENDRGGKVVGEVELGPDDNRQREVVTTEVNDDAVGDSSNEEPEKEPTPTPAQDKLKNLIAEKEKKLNGLYEARDIGLEGESAKFLATQILKTKQELKDLQKSLKTRQKGVLRNAAYRDRRKVAESRLREEHPEFAAALKLRDGPGRPRIECDQPEILKTVLEIATIGSACGDRRREDIYRTVKTLDDLHNAIRGLGFTISRSGLYLKLLPRDGSTIEGRRHVSTVPVKLVRPQNDLRKKHPDRMFAAETSYACDKIALSIGPHACVYIGQDDKSSVFIGKTAAKEQRPMLMNMRYRVRLPDHDFCVGSRHLLVPSVIAHCVIDPKTGVTYTGTTYIAVRSSKHNNSTAFSHQEDLKKFMQLYPQVFKISESEDEIKPVIIKSVDGGPDENPRYENNKKMACKTFLDNNLDCLIEMTQAPGHSAFNRAERRMYHLSKEMTGLVLPHDSFGSHLKNGETIDENLEIRNFEAAGQILCEVWNKLVIDNYETKAEYISDGVDEETKDFNVSPHFRSRHIIETQYMTVIIKCDSPDCCSPMRTDVDLFFPNRRVPALIPIKSTSTGPVSLELVPDVHKQNLTFLDVFGRITFEQKLVPAALKEKYGDKVPYDVYFPTQQAKVEKRFCTVCGMYFSAVKSLAQQHRKICKKPRKKRGTGANRAAPARKKVAPSISIDIEYSDEEVSEGVEVAKGTEGDQEASVDSEEELILNASFIDEDNDEDFENIKEVQLETVGVSVPGEGGIEIILDLKKWLKSPWNLVADN